MYDTQTSNFVNNMARTLAQREQNLYNIMTAGYFRGGGGGGAAAGGAAPGSAVNTDAPMLSKFPGVEQYMQNAFATNLALTGRDIEGNAIPGVANILPPYQTIGMPPAGMYGPGGKIANWMGIAGGAPTISQISTAPLFQPTPKQEDGAGESSRTKLPGEK